MYQGFDLRSNHYRMRISPDIEFAFCTNIISPTDGSISIPNEIVGSRHPTANEMGAYERVLGDAMAGDATLFAREDYVEEAWRIVDPVLEAGTPLHEYDPGTWGPAQAESLAPPGGNDDGPHARNHVARYFFAAAFFAAGAGASCGGVATAAGVTASGAPPRSCWIV